MTTTITTSRAVRGDVEQVAICDRVLAGDDTAREACVRVIDAARARITRQPAILTNGSRSRKPRNRGGHL